MRRIIGTGPKMKTPAIALKTATLAIMLLLGLSTLAVLGITTAPSAFQMLGIVIVTASIIILLDAFKERGKNVDIAEYLMFSVGGIGIASGLSLILGATIPIVQPLLDSIGTLISLIVLVGLTIALFTKGTKA